MFRFILIITNLDEYNRIITYIYFRADRQTAITESIKQLLMFTLIVKNLDEYNRIITYVYFKITEKGKTQ